LTFFIYGEREAGLTKVSEVEHHSVLPEKRIVCQITWKICFADNFPSIVDPSGFASTPSESAEIFEHATFPKKRMPDLIAWKIGCAGDLTPVVECYAATSTQGAWNAKYTPERAKVDHFD
jgi:hypothetical protein